MDGKSLLDSSISGAGTQLTRTLAGLTDEALDFRAHPSAMSLREQLVHLSECYLAMEAEVKGQEYDWGSYKSDLTTVNELVADLFARRRVATDIALSNEEPAAMLTAVSFLVLHDAYHVGQLCLLRQAFDPEWSSFAIYQD